MRLTTERWNEMVTIHKRNNCIEAELYKPEVGIIEEFIKLNGISIDYTKAGEVIWRKQNPNNAIIEKSALEPTTRMVTIIQELNWYKVRVENVLCETDQKENFHLYTKAAQLAPTGWSSDCLVQAVMRFSDFNRFCTGTLHPLTNQQKSAAVC